MKRLLASGEVAVIISVIDSDEVFEAKIVSGLQISSSCLVSLLLLFQILNDRFDDDVAVGEVVE